MVNAVVVGFREFNIWYFYTLQVLIYHTQNIHPVGLDCSGFSDSTGSCSMPRTRPPIAPVHVAGSNALLDLNFIFIPY